MRGLPLLVACFALVSGIPGVAAEKTPKLPLSIFCPAYAEGLKSVFVKTGEDTFQSVALSTANVVDGESALVENGRISLHGPAAADGTHPVVATVEVGEIRRPLLVLVPAKGEGDLAYEGQVIESDPGKFPLGSYKFVNLSTHPVRVSFGEDVIEVEKGADSAFKPDVPAGEVVPVTIDHKGDDDRWQLLSSTRWALRDDRRTLVCFQLDPVSKRMVVKSVPLRESGGK